jgi:hypothetical protein
MIPLGHWSDLRHGVLVPNSLVLKALSEVTDRVESIAPKAAAYQALPTAVDLSGYLHYIRMQGGEGCWRYSLTCKFINSYGDRCGDNGFGTYTLNEMDEKKGKWGTLGNVYVIEPIPPRPVPAARIKVTTPAAGGCRINVHLWLGAEGSPQAKKQIWPPCDTQDDRRILPYTIRLLFEFIWPLSPQNCLVLDLHDSGAFSETGEALEKFTAAFGGHTVLCSQLANGPVNFKARKHVRFFIP